MLEYPHDRKHAQMATIHAASGELIDLRMTSASGPESDSRTLVRTDHVEVFRLTMPAGKELPEHEVGSVITLQCLEGKLEVTAHGRSQAMRAGTMMYLAGGVAHSVRALDDSSLLVTMLVNRV
jgi:quercetin dioxygenase-like cupin family protein